MILQFFDFLTVVEQDDMEKGVEYIRAKVPEDKSIKRCEKRLFEEYLDSSVTSKNMVEEEAGRYI